MPANIFTYANRGRQGGAALVVVLVLLVLMLGVILAFFSQSILQKQISKSSASQTAAELLATGAANTIIGDLKAEIQDANHSEALVTAGGTIYRPKASKFSVPEFSGISPAISGGVETDGLNNLIKISGSASFFSGAPASRGSDETTLPGGSTGRAISKKDWNRSRLLPSVSPSDATPTVADSTMPKWVYVTRQGTKPTAPGDWSPNLSDPTVIVGRYAFAIYNEGGLLDANAAGYPAAVTHSATASLWIADQTAYKSSAAHADLTKLGLDTDQVEALTSWRNAGILQAGGEGSARAFLQFASANPSQFLRVMGGPTAQPTDRAFAGRQQLISFFQSHFGDGSLPLLQYLGTFSRELNQPSIWPDTGRRLVSGQPASGDGTAYTGGNDAPLFAGGENAVNPVFKGVRVGTGFARRDGSLAITGEPLVKKRFPLNTLLWLSYDGPSSEVAASDPLFDQYRKLGLADEELNALRLKGTRANIAQYFGLSWNDAGKYWTYDQADPDGRIKTLQTVATEGRDANFFELLQAGIVAGSLAKGLGNWQNSATYTGIYHTTDTYLIWQVMQIGADIIENANPTRFPIQIRVKVSGAEFTQRKIFGATDLPTLFAYRSIAFPNQQSDPPLPAGRASNEPENGQTNPVTGSGKVAALVVPIIWNPYADDAMAVGRESEAIPSPDQIKITASSEDPTGNPLTASFQPQSTSIYSSGQDWNPYFLSAQDLIKWSEADTTMTFKFKSELYREPTILFRAGLPAGSELAMTGSTLMPASGYLELSSGKSFIGWPLGNDQPLRWSGSVNGVPKILTANAVQINPQSSPFNGARQGGFTVRFYYQAGGSTGWRLYHELWVGGDGSNVAVSDNAAADGSATILTANPATGYGLWDAGSIGTGNSFHWPSRIVWDPRTMRWGTPGSLYPTGDNPLFRCLSTDPDVLTVQSYRPTRSVGDGIGPPSTIPPGWHIGTGQTFGGPSQNLHATGTPQTYYADPDTIVRRAMGGAVGQPANLSANGANGEMPLGLPLASTVAAPAFKNLPAYNPPANQAVSRPFIMHRPYRSVGELGYVFRGTPWKNIDFSFSESGDSGLLDLFCIEEGEAASTLVAGKIDLNTRQNKVLESLLSGAGIDETASKGGTSSVTPKIPDGDAEVIARALISRTQSASSPKGPLTNVSDLVGRYNATASNANGQPFAGFTDDLTGLYSGGGTSAQNLVTRFRESAIRALAQAGMAGTWNLMIDLIAQTGRSKDGKFMTEGQKRYWVHVAIDRQTNKVIDSQVEEVLE
jgi:hypothetical protein